MTAVRRALKDLGLGDAAVQELAVRGVSAAQVSFVLSYGGSAADLDSMLGMGLTFNDAAKLMRSGASAADVVSVQEHGFDLFEVTRLLAAGLSPDDALGVMELAVSGWSAAMVLECGGSLVDVVALAEAGVDLCTAARMLALSCSVADVVQLAGAGALSTEMSGAAVALLRAGACPTVVVQLAGLGVDLEGAARMWARGASVKDVLAVHAAGRDLSRAARALPVEFERRDVVATVEAFLTFARFTD